MNSENKKTPWIGRFLSVRTGTDIVTVLLSATLLTLPIESGVFWPFAFVALVPLFLRMWNRSYWAIFFMGFFTVYLWLFYTLEWVDVYGFHWRLLLVLMNGISYGILFVAGFYFLRRFRHHLFATVFPILFVLIDYRQSIGFLGFPWPIICHTQCSNLPLIQIAALTGCWGVTFLVIMVNEALAHLIESKFKPAILPIAVAPVLLIAIAGLYGAFALAGELPEPDLNVTVVQWEEATNVAWSSEFSQSAIQAYTEQTIEAITPDPAIRNLNSDDDLPGMVIWPETSIPDALRNPWTRTQIQDLARFYDVTMLVGCLTDDPGDSIPVDPPEIWEMSPEYREYNTLVAYDPDGTVIPIYSKIHLVPFGEVIPMKEQIVDWFPEYPWGDTDVSPGTGFFVAETENARVGAVICYESFFPQIVRRIVDNGAEVLVLVSNTSWFGRTRASFQHARFDSLRSVENGIWFCRAATTGVSSIIDPRGRVVDETNIFETDSLTVPISIREKKTLYTKLGDWVPLLSGIYLFLLLVGVFILKKNNEQESAV